MGQPHLEQKSSSIVSDWPFLLGFKQTTLVVPQNAVLHDKLVVLLMSRGAGPGGPTPSTTATGRIISLETWAALGRVTTMP